MFLKPSNHEKKEDVRGHKSNKTMESEKQMNQVILTANLRKLDPELKVGQT